MNITNPNMQTVWQFGQIYEVDWVTEATGSETLALVSLYLNTKKYYIIIYIYFLSCILHFEFIISKE